MSADRIRETMAGYSARYSPSIDLAIIDVQGCGQEIGAARKAVERAADELDLAAERIGGMEQTLERFHAENSALRRIIEDALGEIDDLETRIAEMEEAR